MIDETTAKRQARNKELLLLQFTKIPIVQIACEKVGISRASYYRWRQEDKDFADKSDVAIGEGTLLMNDMAESQLLSLIKDKHPTGIIFWLKHHHPTYAPKYEISTISNKDSLTEANINELTQLLYNKSTFKQGQEMLTSYVFRGFISEKFAQLILKMFISQLRAEDVMTRKAEAEIMTEVLRRKVERKEKKKFEKTWT
ncbi:MAG: hypothetical protein QY322_02105 [bacterium]|nr:MAG: hypothetical protein QY322_02105 [bacterium]